MDIKYERQTLRRFHKHNRKMNAIWKKIIYYQEYYIHELEKYKINTRKYEKAQAEYMNHKNYDKIIGRSLSIVYKNYDKIIKYKSSRDNYLYELELLYYDINNITSGGKKIKTYKKGKTPKSSHKMKKSNAKTHKKLRK